LKIDYIIEGVRDHIKNKFGYCGT